MKEFGGYNSRQNSAYLLRWMVRLQKVLLPMLVIHIILSALNSFYAPVLVKVVIGEMETEGTLKNLFMAVGIYAGVLIVLEFSNGIIRSQLWWRLIDFRMRFLRMVMKKTLTMDYQKLENPRVLDGYNRAMAAVNDESKGIEGMAHSFVDLASMMLQAIIAAGIICTLNPILLILMAGIVLIQFIPIDHTKKREKKEVWDALSPFWRKLHYFNMITKDFEYGKDIRVYHMGEWIYKKQCEVNKDILVKTSHSKNLWIRCHSLLQVLKLLQEGILYVWLIYCVLHREMTIADFTLYIAAVRNFSNAINNFLWKLATFRNQSNEVNDYRKFMEYDEESEESKKLLLQEFMEETAASDSTITSSFQIEFEHVSFCYEGQEKPALENINFTIGEHERLAVVGLNGAGKSTLIKLICRLYEPTEGRILLNGRDIKEIDKREYFTLLAPVFQNVELYAYSLAENISMKSMDRTDEEKVLQCMEQSGLKDKLPSLSKGIHTQMLKVLYDDGTDLSGGERQKLALARALYKDARIVLLDEPTAALDALAEYQMYQEFDQMIGDRMAIYISHRLASTRFCDRIALIDSGKLIELGSHEELLSLNGKYTELYQLQAQYYNLDCKEECAYAE